MTDRAELTSTLADLVSTLRGADEPLVVLDILRCLIFLKYAAFGLYRSGNDEMPLRIPREAQWSYLQRCEHDLGESLEHACRTLEETNPVLAGMLASVDFTRIERLDGDRRDRVLKQLIERTSKLPRLRDSVQVGEVYDSLMLMFAESGGKSGAGEMFLSVPLARLMVALLDLRSGMRVCDPVCMAGRTLVACLMYALEMRLDISLEGQVPYERLGAICKMNLLLHGARDARIESGDVLHSPMLTDGGRLIRYNRVLMAPPINRANWGAEDAAKDQFSRFPIIPPKHNADYAYILHCLSILESGSKAVILTDRGVLFRQGAEEPIRRMLVERDQFEAVIGLPGGLLYGTHIPAALLVLRKGKSPRSGKVLFVEVRRSNERRSRHEALRPDEIDAVITCAQRFEDAQGMSRVVDLHEIAQRQWVLNPATYIRQQASYTDATVDLVEEAEMIRVLEVERDEAASRVDDLLRELAEQIDR